MVWLPLVEGFYLDGHHSIAPMWSGISNGNGGAEALVERMGAIRIPWIFNESNRPSFIE